MHHALKKYFLVAALFVVVLSGCSTSQGTKSESRGYINLDTVKAGQFDTGKMWTFDFPPTDYFSKAYNFTPTSAWFEKARLSALRLPGCSASFVSEDGLVMTNHHCARGALDAVNRQGENLPETGFFAATQADERKIPGYYADQLVLMEDVTAEVQRAFESGATDEERIANRTKAITEIEQRYRTKTKLICNVITFYNGGKYSLYGYKRYTDVRLVFAPETDVAYYGGDYDNFTYPRYDLDVSFYRIYDKNGQPLKAKNFYAWSKAGAGEDEAVFVVGNPGRTNRLYTYSQLEYQRDVLYPYTFALIDKLMNIYTQFIANNPDKKLRYQTRLFSFSNSQKLYVGRLEGLRDPILMAKKKDFEKTFKAAVANNPQLKSRYASLWNEIEALQPEKANLFGTVNAYEFRGPTRSTLFTLASNLIDFATQMNLPLEKRNPRYKGAAADSFKVRFYPANFDPAMDKEILTLQLTSMKSVFGEKNEQFNKLLAGRTTGQAASDLISSSLLSNKEKVVALLNASPADMLQSSDPLISFIVTTSTQAQETRDRFTEINAKEQAKVQMLGKAVYDVYGTSIPPDATFTLRIADGVVKGYSYNGTIAPYFTTFYGMYDRYYSYGKKAPWNLPDRWQHPQQGFDMSTPFNFVSTNDIIGGNSGSPVVNKNLEIVGIAFDGNIESLPGDMIYTDEKNRCVALHSSGILEALEDIYNAARLAKELRAGHIVE